MNENTLVEILLEGTQLIKKVATDEISIEDFLKEYNNFYYYNALDGHEGKDLTLDLFEKYSDVIRLHKDIQTNVVDLIYLGSMKGLPTGSAPNRITANEGKKQIKVINRKHNINKILSVLTDAKGSP